MSLAELQSSPDALQSQIERQNEEIKQELMMLRFKLDPRVIKAQVREVVGPPAIMKGIKNMLNEKAQDLKDAVKSQVEAVKETLGSATSSAKDGIGAIASSAKDNVGSMASSAKDSVSSFASSAKDSVGSMASTAKDGVGSFASSAKDSVSSFAASAKDGAGSMMSSVKENAGSMASSVKGAVQDRAQHVGSTVKHNPWSASMLASGVGLALAGVIVATASNRRHNEDSQDGNTNYSSDLESYDSGPSEGSSFTNILHDQPLLLGSAVLLAGAALGFVLPRSTYEQKLVGETSDRFVREVKDRVQGTIAEAKTTVKDQVNELKNVASDAGREMKQTVLSGMSSM
jgi:phage-related protein